MRYTRGLSLLAGLVVATTLCSAVACTTEASKYIGRWECSSGGGDFFEIKANDDAYLVTDESGTTYSASLDKATLVLTGVPLMGSLPLPIDSGSGELICSACTCKRYRIAPKSEQGTRPAQELPASVEVFTAANPNIELVEYNSGKATVTLRHKKTGEILTLRVEDIEQGKIVVN
jgi:hypothetical protein